MKNGTFIKDIAAR